MNKQTLESLLEQYEKTKEVFCPICGQGYDGEEAFNQLCEHFEIDHGEVLEETSEKLSSLAEEHSQTISNWKDEKKKELLFKIAQERPQLLHEIQCSPHADEMLDKMVEEDLFKRALKVNTLSSFDAMWLKHPKFEEIYRTSREKPEHQPQIGDSTGQSEETIEIPNSPESKKVLEKKTPVNRVSFKDGKLILEPEYEPERLPRNIKYAGNKEELSDEDRRRKEVLILLTALMRKRKQ